MLKVMLVDDEPFILQGVKALINWEEEGCEVVATCANGLEAYNYLQKNQVDIIIADIKMPEMTGLELLEKIRTEKISDAFFVVLTGFKDFSYAQTALRFDCMDYLLKPVGKTELLGIIRKLTKASEERYEERESRDHLEREFLARNMIALLFGKFDEKNLSYVKSYVQVSDEIRYVDIELNGTSENIEELEEGEIRGIHRNMYSDCLDFLGDEKNHCVFDVARDERSHDVGLIYCDYFVAKRNTTMEDFFEKMKDYIKKNTGLDITIFIGKKIDKLESISKSYSSACALKSIGAFRSKKAIYIYEEEISVSESTVIIAKDRLDDIITAIDANSREQIETTVRKLFDELGNNLKEDTVRLNVNYLLFRLIHKATEMADDIDQEEVLRFIAEHSTENEIMRGSSMHLCYFCVEYAQYLSQLRENISGGVVLEIEKEIRDNYMDNITLRDLGKKYFVNSSYLGQIFQKKYNKTFKDYLTEYRIEMAKQKLLNTDMRIAEIAESVGYKDSDYFLKKFIEANGCTPSKYRKNCKNSTSG